MRALLVAVLLAVQVGTAPVAAAGPAGAGPAAGAAERLRLGPAHVIDGSRTTPLSPGATTATGIAVPDRDEGAASFLVDAAAGPPTTIGLPVPTDAPSRTPEGALVYGSGAEVSVTVRAVDVSEHEHLAVALQAVIVIDDASAPTSYAFPLRPPPGGSTRSEPHGAVSVRDRKGRPVGLFTAPWAVDAAGQPVRTWFSLADGSLVQHVRPSDHTVFPVVADPFFVVPALVVGGRVLLQIGAVAATRAAATSLATATVAALPKLSPALLTARPMSLVAKSRFDRVLTDGSRHYYTRGDAQAIFSRITRGGRASGPSRRVATDGHTATLYSSSLTSVATIHVNTGSSIYKVRIVP